jgi:hypothetical protein
MHTLTSGTERCGQAVSTTATSIAPLAISHLSLSKVAAIIAVLNDPSLQHRQSRTQSPLSQPRVAACRAADATSPCDEVLRLLVTPPVDWLLPRSATIERVMRFLLHRRQPSAQHHPGCECELSRGCVELLNAEIDADLSQHDSSLIPGISIKLLVAAALQQLISSLLMPREEKESSLLSLLQDERPHQHQQQGHSRPLDLSHTFTWQQAASVQRPTSQSSAFSAVAPAPAVVSTTPCTIGDGPLTAKQQEEKEQRMREAVVHYPTLRISSPKELSCNTSTASSTGLTSPTGRSFAAQIIPPAQLTSCLPLWSTSASSSLPPDLPRFVGSPGQPRKSNSKRRRSDELEEKERWYCQNDDCAQFYRKTSGHSIARHLLVCCYQPNATPAAVTPTTAITTHAGLRQTAELLD